MATTRVSVLFEGKDQGVSSAANKAGGAIGQLDQKSDKSSKKISEAFKKVAIVIGATILIARQLKQMFDRLAETYQKQIEAEVKLHAALKATGGQVGINFNEMKRMATAMSDVTAIADESIIAAQGLLVTFTKIGKDVFPQALNAAADMSAMFGQDLQQSVIQLGTALNDPIAGVGRLRRIGISFSEEQKKSIQQYVEQNDLMAAQGVILDELQNEFGGVAAAMGGTALGALKRFENAVGDTMEVIGGAAVEGVKPIVEEMTKFLNDSRDTIGAIFRNLPQIAQIAFDAVVKVIRKTFSFQFAGAVIVNFGKAFLNSIVTVAKALPELIWSALSILITPIQNFANWLGSVFEKIFADVANFFIDALNAIPFVEIEKVQTKEIQNIGDVWDSTLNEMDSHFNKFSSKLGESMVSVSKDLLDASVETAKEFAPIIAEAGAQIDVILEADKKRQAALEAAQNNLQQRQAEINEQLKAYSEAWEDVVKTAEGLRDPLDKQEAKLVEMQNRLLSYSNIFERGTDDFNQWSEVLTQIDTQLLEITKKRAGIESIVSRYANVFKSEAEALKAREAALMKELTALNKYKQVLSAKIEAYQQEGKSTEALTDEVSEISRVTELMKDEIDEVQKEIKGSSNTILSAWDLLFSDVTDIFDNFVNDAKEAYAKKAGVKSEDLTPEQEQAAITASALDLALSSLAEIAQFLVEQFVGLLLSTAAFQEVMSAFSETLQLVVEFAVVPLIEAIKPLLTVMIALISVIANIVVPIFKMLGLLIQAVMPVFIALGQIIIAVSKVLVYMLPPIIAIISILTVALAPVLRVIATLFETLGVVLQTLTPVFEILAFVVRVVATPIAVIGATFEWLGNIIYNFGKFVNNVVNNVFDPSKWGQGFRRTDLGGMISDAVAAVWAGPSVNDFSSQIDFEDIPDFTQDLVFGGTGEQTQFEDLTPGIEGGGIYGGGTTVTQVPDINIHQHFHAPVIGDGGKEAVGQYIVEAIQDYLGVGGTVTWLETTEGAV